MNVKILLFLGLASIGVGYATYWLDSQNAAFAQDSGLFYPKLAEQINQVTQLQIQLPTGVITLTRDKQHWSLSEKDGYPADFGKVRSLLLGLAQLEIIEAKTRMPSRYTKLGVEEPTTKDAKSSLLHLVDDKGASLVTLIVGKRREAGASSSTPEYYARKAKDDQAWLVAGNLDLGSQEVDWLYKELVAIDEKRIRQVEIRQTTGESLQIYKDSQEQTDFQIKDLPPETKVESPYRVNSIAFNLAALSLEDVRPAQVLVDAVPSWEAELTTFDGLRLTLASLRLSTKTEQDNLELVRISARYDASQVIPAKPQKDDEAMSKSSEGILSAEAVTKEAEAINAKLGNWAYILPEYRLNSINKTQSDFISKPEEEVATPDTNETPESAIFDLLNPAVLSEDPAEQVAKPIPTSVLEKTENVLGDLPKIRTEPTVSANTNPEEKLKIIEQANP